MDNIIIVDDYEKCFVCGNETNIIDYIAEIRICNEECQDKFWEPIYKSIKKMDWNCFMVE
jgi:hypothetical protein